MKVMVIGLDCATPQLLFGDWLERLPNIRKLIKNGVHGEMASSTPAITVPAWMSMMTSKTPGELGFYGFRNRKNYSYDEMFFATSNVVKEDTVWDILSRENREVIVVGVPPSYPPKPVNGNLISCFLTPGTDVDFTYPKKLKQEITENVGEYILDVKKFRTEDKDYLIDQIYKLAENRFATFSYLIENKSWDFAMMVEMGVDRLHHGLWKYMDKDHPKYEAGNKYEHVIGDYYEYIDGKIGELLEKIDDDTAVMIVSDHGAKRMVGGICFNDWLIQEGFLALNETPEGPMPMKNSMIDWNRTKAWGSGGYYGRLFMNVAGREPYGTIPPEDYEKERDALKAKIEQITDPEGNNIGCKAFKPEEIYPKVKNIAPDLIVYFGDLYWRSVGSIGNESIWTFENDTGPDDANHAEHGVIILKTPENTSGLKLEGVQLMDVAPTILELIGVNTPADMHGHSLAKK
ncbi:alkaline phosphatase family protein [bacterium]|nr:alkaline phosphatase family protein [bacterium]